MIVPAHKSAMARAIDICSRPDRTRDEEDELDRLRLFLDGYKSTQRACAGIDVDAFLWDLGTGDKALVITRRRK